MGEFVYITTHEITALRRVRNMLRDKFETAVRVDDRELASYDMKRVSAILGKYQIQELGNE